MVWDAINVAIGIVVGLITGLATGYYFERRQTRAARAGEQTARAENARLVFEVDELKAAMTKLNVNVIGTMPVRNHNTGLTRTGSLAADLAVAAKSMVDGASRVRIGLLYEKFCAEEFTVEEVDAAIQSLVDLNHVIRDRAFLEVTF